MATFYNRATLTYKNYVTNSNTVTGEILETLSVTKNAVDDNYSAGEDLAYVISIVNSGPAAFAGLTVTDDLGAYPFGTGTVTPLTYVEGTATLYVDGALLPAPTVTQTDPLTITGINVPAGGNAIIVYRARVNELAPLDQGAAIVNTATVSGGGIATPITAEETVTATAAPYLTITKALSPLTVIENGQIKFLTRQGITKL